VGASRLRVKLDMTWNEHYSDTTSVFTMVSLCQKFQLWSALILWIMNLIH